MHQPITSRTARAADLALGERIIALDTERRTVAHLILADVRRGANAEQHPMRQRLEDLASLAAVARRDARQLSSARRVAA